jgi:hypothetical protein
MKVKMTRKKYFKLREERLVARDQRWCSIPVFNQKEIIIDVNAIYSQVDAHIEDGLPLRASLGSTGIGFLTIVGNEVWPSFCARLVEQEKHFKVFNIKK